MNKLRLDYFLSLGGEFINRDKYFIKTDSNITVVNGVPVDYDKDCFVESFAQRKNEGVQPVGDDMPVVANLRGGAEYKDVASKCAWYATIAEYYIESWTPDLEAIIKMQNEYDLKSPASCSFHGSSVTSLEGSGIKLGVDSYNHTYTQTMKDAGELPCVGIIGKFKGEWLSDGEPHPLYSASSLGWEDGDEIEIINIHNSVFVAFNNQSDVLSACSIPLKMFEPISTKLEIAKKEQVNDAAKFLVDKYGFLDGPARQCAEEMQKNGLFVEVDCET